MQKITLLLACLVCACHGRRMRTSEGTESLQSLATLLVSNPAAAFNPGSNMGTADRSASQPAVATRVQDLSMKVKDLADVWVPPEKRQKGPVKAKKVSYTLQVNFPGASKKASKKVSYGVQKKFVKKVAAKKKATKKAATKKSKGKSSGGFFLNAGFTSGAAADVVGRSDTSWVDVFDPQGLGIFDPAGFTVGKSEKEVLAYREAELKHGRISMLAALGFVVQEKFHPLFGGDIDTPSAYALLDSRIWEKAPSGGLAVILTSLFLLEVVSSLSVFNLQGGKGVEGDTFGLPDDYTPGDIFKPIGGTFDPLGLAPSDPVEFEVMQTKELNNGRLAMLAILGMFLQEIKTGQALFA